MAEQHSMEGLMESNVGGESSESTVELNIKTLDSQIYSFQVDKNIPVSQFKEKIASEIGLPAGQQRLIFRGKVLKDDHLLSEYHVENGHTLHLVARQPSESQAPSSSGNGETSASTDSRGHDANGAGGRNRGGQISHSVVLGTLNVGDQGEGVVPDLTRVIGAVLNSIGIGGQTTTNVVGGGQPIFQFNTPPQAPQHETEGTQNNSGAQGQAGPQAQPGQPLPSQSLPHLLQIPLGAAIPVPSLNAPIPDSLHTLSEFMNRMELTLSQNGYQPNQSPTNSGDIPMVELPPSARGLSTPSALVTVLQHAQRLLSGRTIAALSHIAGRLEQESGSTDPTVRGQIQTEAMQIGLAMQHLGALLLELGRTILTLRMGQSPSESYVNAGPAVYISPSGPNPIMVQPFPLQTSSLFGGTTAAPSNPGTSGPVGIGAIPRHVNIHIHTAVGPRASNVEGVQGESVNQTGPFHSGQTRVLPLRNVTAAAVPSRPSGAVSNASQTGISLSQPSPDNPLSTAIAEVSSRIRNYVDNMRTENQALSGRLEGSTGQNPSVEHGAGDDGGNNQLRDQADNGAGEASVSAFGGVSSRADQKAHTEQHQPNSNKDTRSGVSSKDVSSSCPVGGSTESSNRESTLKLRDDLESRSGLGNDNPEGATAVPLGLGLGGLQPKRRNRQSRAQGKDGDSATSSSPSQNQQTRGNHQQVLQSLASLTNRNSTTTSSAQMPPGIGDIMRSVQMGGQGADGQLGDVMSQVLQSPALNGLLAGVSEQAGIGSPNVLRNMLEQVTQSPTMRNTVNQIAQQFDNQDLGSMFSGLGGTQDGGINLANMVQQMMPLVSQALSGVAIPQRTPAAGPDPQPQYDGGSSSRDLQATNQNSQIDIEQVVQGIEHHSPPGEIFRSMVETAARLYDSSSGAEDFVDELSREEGLASEFMEILRQDLHHRVLGERESGDRS